MMTRNKYIPPPTKFITINGFLYGMTRADNRFRRNWRNCYRRPLTNKWGECEECGEHKKLTIHHDPPLYISLDGKEVKLCNDCHVEVEKECSNKYHLNERPHILRCDDCGGFIHLHDNIIKCFNCKNVILLLRKLKENVYETKDFEVL